MDNNEQDQSPSSPEDDFRASAEEMLRLLENGQMSDALMVVNRLNEVRDRSLFQEVGRLTRALHDSIRNFDIETRSAEANSQMSQMGDASERLDYVTRMTEQAANRTMDLAEASAPVALGLVEQASDLKSEWLRLKNRDMGPAEFRELYQRMGEFLTRVEDDGSQFYQNMNEVMLAQDYQDLTGQVIKKVVSLVQEVESSLVGLVRMASQVDQLTGIHHDLLEEGKDSSSSVEEQQQADELAAYEGEGPQIHQEAPDVVSDQDDVDDLLSSLGF